MTYAILSDIHANASALRAVLADARRMGAEGFVCLGDVVGYGPEPVEAVRLVREACAVVLAGNHDDAVSGRLDATDFIGLAADAVARHRAALARGDLDWLAARPYRCTLDGGALAAHGDATESEKFYYVETEEDAAANFAATDAPLLFVGHTHVPGLFLTGASGAVYKLPPQDFTREEGKRYIVNVGSVGYPREAGGRCLSSYVLYDAAEGTVTFRFLPFAVSSVMQRGDAPAPPRKTARWRTVLMVVLPLLLLAGGGAAALRTRPARPVASAAVPAPDPSAALLVCEKTLDIPLSARNIRAYLQLKRGSPPVTLQVEFYAAGRQRIKGWTLTVPQSSKKPFPVPKGTVSVRIAVLREKTEDIPLVTRFAPAVE